MSILLFLVLFLSFSFSAEIDPLIKVWEKKGYLPEKVIVLLRDGTVRVESLKRRSLWSLKADSGISYIQAPRRLKPAREDFIGYSTLAVWGRGNSIIQIQTNNGQNLSIVPFNAGVSIGGSCAGSIENLTCGNGTLNISTNTSGDFRILIASTNQSILLSQVSGASALYYVGSGAMISNRNGNNVLVGVIDSGINFCHPLFRGRVLYFYEPSSGLLMDKPEIDRKANSGDCNYDGEGHGTRVAGVIARLAPQAQFIVVKLTEWTDAEVIEGLNFIREKAIQFSRPVAVNLSFVGHFDPHDGTGLLDRAVDLFSSKGRIVVASAGNEGEKAIHASAHLTSPAVFELVSFINAGDIIDGWYTGIVKVELCRGSTCVGANPGDFSAGDLGSCPVYIDNTITSSPLNGQGEFIVDFYCSGNLTLKVIPYPSAEKVDVYLAHPFGNSRFLSNTSQDSLGGFLGTVGTPGTSKSAITAGALTNFPILGPSRINERSFSDLGLIAFFSSRGPTRDGRVKPDISAGGLWVYGAINDGISIGPSAGTSFSAPVVTAIVAQLLEVSSTLTPEEVKNILCSSALKDAAVGDAPNNVYGCGKANAISSAPTQDSGGGSGGGGGCSFNHSGSDFGIIFLLIILTFRRLIVNEKIDRLRRTVFSSGS